MFVQPNIVKSRLQKKKRRHQGRYHWGLQEHHMPACRHAARVTIDLNCIESPIGEITGMWSSITWAHPLLREVNSSWLTEWMKLNIMNWTSVKHGTAFLLFSRQVGVPSTMAINSIQIIHVCLHPILLDYIYEAKLDYLKSSSII